MISLLQEKYNRLLLERKLERIERNKVIGQFITFACNSLEIPQPYPSVHVNMDLNFGAKLKSFVYFRPADNKIVVSMANRNLADALRTIAHELTHFKQRLDKRITDNPEDKSGETGSEIENEANARAGIIMREFGKSHPEIYE